MLAMGAGRQDIAVQDMRYRAGQYRAVHIACGTGQGRVLGLRGGGQAGRQDSSTAVQWCSR